jgi:hypothetical protein
MCLSAIRTHYIPGKMPVPSQEGVGFQLFRCLKIQMVELLIGFLFLWTFPLECALEYGTIVITFIR